VLGEGIRFVPQHGPWLSLDLQEKTRVLSRLQRPASNYPAQGNCRSLCGTENAMFRRLWYSHLPLITGYVYVWFFERIGPPAMTDLSPRRHGFDPRLVDVGFLIDKVTLVQVFLTVFWFSLSVSSSHQCSIHIHSSITNTTQSQSLAVS
jgi:hypothetical protein